MASPPGTKLARTALGVLALLSGAGASMAAFAASADAELPDALALESAPVAAATAQPSPLRLAIEAGFGRIDPRDGLGDRNGQRLSIDLRVDKRLSDAWRVGLSDRFDSLSPALPGQPVSTNSLREAYVGWQDDGGLASAEVGRINLRNGPAYGYNPTDYFRAGALRSITTADPVALRERRMGTVMLRLGRLWSDGGVSLALAPKLDNARRPDDVATTSSLDLSATNSRDRAAVVLTQKVSERLSGQVSGLAQRGGGSQLGFSVTALATDALVAYAELSVGKVPRLFDEVRGLPGDRAWRQKSAVGATYTFPGSLSVTLEAETNGAGLDRRQWQQLTAFGTPAYLRYLSLTQPSQEVGSRRAWLLFATQKDVGIKQLDVSALVRTNGNDGSGLAWAELRYHWPRVDAVLQWQRSFGGSATEFGVMPYRQVIQVLGVFYL